MCNEDELRRGVLYEKEEFNQKEIEYFRNNLLEHIANLIDYFDNDDTPSYKTGEPKTVREKLESLAFCILTTIDAEDGNAGGYYMIPITESHFYDPEYYIPDDVIGKYDIAGQLNNNLFKFINKENK